MSIKVITSLEIQAILDALEHVFVSELYADGEDGISQELKNELEEVFNFVSAIRNRPNREIPDYEPVGTSHV